MPENAPPAKNPKITLLDADTLGDADLAPLRLAGELTAFPISAPGEVGERLRGADCAVANKAIIGAEALAQAPDLRLIAVAATGVNNIDLKAAAERGVAVCNVAGYSTDSVAQHAIALLLMLATNAHRFAAEPRRWAESPFFTRFDFPAIELAGKTFGIVGCGAIGQRAGAAAEALGMRVACLGRAGSAAAARPDWPRLETADFFAACDAVSLHCPMTESNAGMIGEAALGQMKRTVRRGLQSDLNTTLQMEAMGQQVAGDSSDAAEGIMAFLQKRKPEFKGS